MEITDVAFDKISERYHSPLDYTKELEPLTTKLFSIPNVHPITNQLLIKETIQIGLKRIPENKPFSLVTFTEDTQFHKYTVNRIVTSVLLKWEVPKVTGMSIKELLDMPIFELQNLIDVVKECMGNKTTTDEKLVAQMLRENKKL